MPYVHWDTDRKREKMARLTQEETERHRVNKFHAIEEARKKRKKGRKGLDLIERTIKHRDAKPSPAVQKIMEYVETLRHGGKGYAGALEFTDLAVHAMNSTREDKNRKKGSSENNNSCCGEKTEEAIIRFDSRGRAIVSNPLGQLLIDAARLYEAMSVFRDEQLLKKYLHHNPPLHTRRTLDQSYYWILKSTKARDRDQVVYRGTRMVPDFSHTLQQVQEAQEEVSRLKFWQKQPEPRGRLEWKYHWRETDKHGCEQCRSEIRKVPRLIMVDQLWMWILDESTIITLFPKRYGVNKQDLSGVHRSIRMRLKTVRKNQIRSVFDLALIILDECSNTFFDRTKTQVRQLCFHKPPSAPILTGS